MKRLYIAALCLAAFCPAAFASDSVQKDTTPVAIRAQGNPRLNDFLAIAAKRSDLRLAINQHGLDTAFADWLGSTFHAYSHRSESCCPACCSQQTCCK